MIFDRKLLLNIYKSNNNSVSCQMKLYVVRHGKTDMVIYEYHID